ncbi:MAG: hypothetical protein KDA81_14565 [Planctomycetaceae bacterium]|nr:hypothetical protein [Planctomycetaceae bacterium]
MTTMVLPFEQLNLRRNPFGEFSEQERAELAVVDVDGVAERLSHSRTAVQFVGEKGFGKTTHLLALRLRFSESAYVHIPEGERLTTVPTGSPLMIDEAQRLTFSQRRTVFRYDRPLVLGTHTNFHRALERAGRHVETIHVGDGTSVDRLHRILNDRIERVRRTAGSVPQVTPKTCRRMLQRHGPDVRGIMSDLYDQFQRLMEICDV